MTNNGKSNTTRTHPVDMEGSNERQEKKGLFDSLPKAGQFLILTMGMFIFFGAHNLLQEAVMKIPGFSFGVMLGYMDVIGVTVGSFIERKYFAKEYGRKAPISAYPLLTLCLLASSSLSNMSLDYINFPTKVVFRSCKLLPTMVIASIMNKRVFSSLEYTLAMAVCIGLVLFAAADWKLTPTFNPIGLVLVSLSVVADSILPNAQERLFSLGSSRLEVTFYSNLFTLIAMTVSTLSSGTMFEYINLVLSDTGILMVMCLYTLVAYVAISFFMQIVKRFGAVTGVLAAAARKAMTLMLSFLVFPKEFSWLYVAGSILVLGSLLATSMLKIRKKSLEIESMKSEDSQKLLRNSDSNV